MKLCIYASCDGDTGTHDGYFTSIKKIVKWLEFHQLGIYPYSLLDTWREVRNHFIINGYINVYEGDVLDSVIYKVQQITDIEIF